MITIASQDPRLAQIVGLMKGDPNKPEQVAGVQQAFSGMPSQTAFDKFFTSLNDDLAGKKDLNNSQIQTALRKAAKNSIRADAPSVGGKLDHVGVIEDSIGKAFTAVNPNAPSVFGDLTPQQMTDDIAHNLGIDKAKDAATYTKLAQTTAQIQKPEDLKKIHESLQRDAGPDGVIPAQSGFGTDKRKAAIDNAQAKAGTSINGFDDVLKEQQIGQAEKMLGVTNHDGFHENLKDFSYWDMKGLNNDLGTYAAKDGVIPEKARFGAVQHAAEFVKNTTTGLKGEAAGLAAKDKIEEAYAQGQKPAPVVAPPPPAPSNESGSSTAPAPQSDEQWAREGMKHPAPAKPGEPPQTPDAEARANSKQNGTQHYTGGSPLHTKTNSRQESHKKHPTAHQHGAPRSHRGQLKAEQALQHAGYDPDHSADGFNKRELYGLQHGLEYSAVGTPGAGVRMHERTAAPADASGKPSVGTGAATGAPKANVGKPTDITGTLRIPSMPGPGRGGLY